MNRILYMDTTLFEDNALFDKGMSLISRDRQEKIKKLKNPIAARLSLGAGILLRIAMERCQIVDQINELRYTKYGKPFLECDGFHFSLSHSGKYALCVYSDLPIGADLQAVKNTIPRYTKKILSNQEENFLLSFDESNRNHVFARLWARKESLIKWDGRGLRIPLQEISFVQNGEISDYIFFDGKTVYFKEFSFLSPEYALCICSEKKEFPTEYEEIDSKFLTKY